MIEVFRDEVQEDHLIGRFQPKAHMTGFPGITHGGSIYTAIDCLASWTPTVLIPEVKAAWILRSAEIKYLSPAHVGLALILSAKIAKATWIQKSGSKEKIMPKKWKPILVRTTAHNEEGILLVEASFKLVPLTAEKLKSVAGIAQLPDNWSHLLNET